MFWFTQGQLRARTTPERATLEVDRRRRRFASRGLTAMYAGSMFKPGDLVRHRSKPEWGVGRVSGQTGEGKVLVKFTGRAGDVLLTAAGAEQHLVPDTGGVWAPPSRAASAVPAATRRTPCVHCAADLRDVVTAPKGEWRSCPECSVRHGRQHVFLPFPREFDIVDVPNSTAAVEADAGAGPAAIIEPDPKAQWCRSCRAGQRSSGFRLCKDVNR
jgi:Protein of unknown function (DUF3553)